MGYALHIAYMGVVGEFPVTPDTTTGELIAAACERFSITRQGWRLLHNDGREVPAGHVLPLVVSHVDWQQAGADDSVLMLIPQAL